MIDCAEMKPGSEGEQDPVYFDLMLWSDVRNLPSSQPGVMWWTTSLYQELTSGPRL